MKLFPKIAIAFFVVAGLVLLLTDKAIWPNYYDLPYMGYAALACALAVFLIPLRFKVPLSWILLMSGLGDLGLYQLYQYGFEYDKLVHVTVPLIAVFVISRVYGIRNAIIIAIVGSFAWELFEYLADTFIKTHLFGVYRHQIFTDTMLDILANTSGIAIGIVLYYYKSSGKYPVSSSMTGN